jgi:phospholipase C
VTGREPALGLQLTNNGTPQVTFTLTSNAFVAKSQTVTAKGGKKSTVSWPVDEWGYYDVVVTANTGTGYRYRFAGRVE